VLEGERIHKCRCHFLGWPRMCVSCIPVDVLGNAAIRNQFVAIAIVE